MNVKTADPKSNKAMKATTMKRKATTTNSIKPTSPVAMGKALVILATSCAALSSHPTSIGSVRSSTNASQGRRVVHGRARLHHRHHGYYPKGYSNAEGRAFHSMIALRYRDGDEDQSPMMRMANQAALDSATAAVAAEARAAAQVAASAASDPSSIASHGQVVATPTARHQALTAPTFALFNFPVIKLSSRPRTASMSTPTSSPTPASKEQLAMDEYIEYVERRYSRSHPKQHNTQQLKNTRRPRVVLDFQLPRKIFLYAVALHRPAPGLTSNPVAAKPLMAHNTVAANYQAAAAAQDDDGEEDPLNVLGLSSLASPQLRQRLHVPRDLRDEASLLASSTESAVNFLSHCMMHSRLPAPPTLEMMIPGSAANSKAAAASKVALAAEGGRTSSYTSLSPVAQAKLLLRTIKSLALAFMNTFKILTAFASRMFSEILDKGGFRKSVRMLGMASVCVLLMFKPLFSGALKQG